MGYCAWYGDACPYSNICTMWDDNSSTCTWKRQKSLLELINLKGADSIASSPPTGAYKVLNTYYDDENEEHVVIRSDTPEE